MLNLARFRNNFSNEKLRQPTADFRGRGEDQGAQTSICVIVVIFKTLWLFNNKWNTKTDWRLVGPSRR